MEFNIYKSKPMAGKNKLELVGGVQASSLDIASDLVYRRLRKNTDKVNGQAYFIVPYNEKMKKHPNEMEALKGTPFRVVQFRHVQDK